MRRMFSPLRPISRWGVFAAFRKGSFRGPPAVSEGACLDGLALSVALEVRFIQAQVPLVYRGRR
jgi:hypothetical protein